MTPPGESVRSARGPARSVRGPVSWWLLGGLAAVAAIAGGAAAGWWFLPFLAGLAAGVAARYGRWRPGAALLASAVLAAVGWAVPLGWSAWQGAPVGATARVVAALAGLPPYAPVAIIFTLLVAVIQAVLGCWLASSLIPRQEH